MSRLNQINEALQQAVQLAIAQAAQLSEAEGKLEHALADKTEIESEVKWLRAELRKRGGVSTSDDAAYSFVDRADHVVRLAKEMG